MLKLKITHPFWQVIGLGMLAGMRSQSAPAIASHLLSCHQLNFIEKNNVTIIRPEKLGVALKELAIADAAIDGSPKRRGTVRSLGLVSRCISGSLVGASIYKACGGNVLAGSLLGGVTGLCASLAGFYLSSDADSKKYVMMPLIIALEDALVIGASGNVSSAV